ncbi:MULTISPECIES: phosphate ABC transporter permease subunit PstC [unclassified Thermosynechococcus]|uniref:phosphate ABC transporter permease subunit PstC n=1 Tax=unclassified Thermosynechococcus TaxID=2622553 RepID=UPI00197F23E2|nr:MULTISPECIES: phosphate ABC transporter permease subunit PstC [unclassified Thermosynechococcus]MDR5637805.1 phosphate ABC transporter permease subunit PstC [Thermosynechococcus sp. PP42]MDR7896726.1 phosphate ABC transporter permease subunit PstC [Thermosynechococcus sp. JY1332]MDR7904123.1 phosphate ABC transporter permease subunit PstC [Thermosynechococcus sp. JY1334]MDR7920597.1 phosphate ABC transporter permease subunit PstC [Thermosynechococcus sp. HY213]QSF49236.1 phosphate ABC trans
MAVTSTPPESPDLAAIEARKNLRYYLDQSFYYLTMVFALAVAVALLWIVIQIGLAAIPAITRFGLRFLASTTWDPVQNIYGILPQIYGTLVSALIALLVAVPLGLGIAVFLSEDFLPTYIRTPIAFAIELLAAIPSVVIGLWGIFVLIPFLRPFYNFLHEYLGWIPLFGTSPRGNSILTLGLVLAFMILPLITSISRETLVSLPPYLRQGAMALGATRWETILRVLIPAGFSGIVGSIMLALGRAMGETMAAAMLVGNTNRISLSILEPGSTIASLIASQFGEAGREQVAALLYAGLVLMILTLLVNILAEIIIKKFQNVER